jgi:hypothetical protein
VLVRIPDEQRARIGALYRDCAEAIRAAFAPRDEAALREAAGVLDTFAAALEAADATLRAKGPGA